MNIAYEKEYKNFGGIAEGLQSVQDSITNLWGFVDVKTGKEVIPCKYDYVCNFSEGFAQVETAGKWGYIDKTGKNVIKCEYDYVGGFKNDYAKVELHSKFGYINKTGREIVPCIYDDVCEPQNGLTRASKHGKWGVVDNDIETEIVPCVFEHIGEFCDGFAEVTHDGCVGFINEKGELVVKNKFYDCKITHSNGVAYIVTYASKKLFIDLESGEVIKCLKRYEKNKIDLNDIPSNYLLNKDFYLEVKFLAHAKVNKADKDYKFKCENLNKIIDERCEEARCEKEHRTEEKWLAA